MEELIRGFNEAYDHDFSSFFIADLNATYPDRRWIDGNVQVISEFYWDQSFIKINSK